MGEGGGGVGNPPFSALEPPRALKQNFPTRCYKLGPIGSFFSFFVTWCFSYRLKKRINWVDILEKEKQRITKLLKM